MSIEAMKQALAFVEQNTYGGDDVTTLMNSLRQAIEQAEKQEPVAWVNWCAATGKRSVSFECESELASQPLYFCITQITQNHYSKQIQWVGLTDEEIALVCAECAASAHNWNDISFARAIEQALKEKNT